MIDKMTANKKKFIPKEGFNVVGVDDYEDPGEQLFLIAHYKTEDVAKARLDRFKKNNPDTPAYVYGPDTR